MNKERKQLKWVIAVIALLATVGVGVAGLKAIERNNIEKARIAYIDENSEKLNQELEFGDEVTLWHDENVVTPENEKDLKFKAEKLGETKLNVVFKHNDSQTDWDVPYEIKVVDTTAPKITGTKDITTTEKVDYKKGVKAVDEVDGDVEVKFEGKVDFDKPGKYTITAKAEDKSGNVAEKKFTITVEEVKVEEPEVKETQTPSSSNTTTNKPQSTPKPNKNQSNNTAKPQPKPQPKPESKPKPQPKPEPSLNYYDSMARELFNLTNKTRRENGLKELYWSNALVPAAKTRAKEITTYFSHTRPNGSAWWTVNPDLAYGENLAYGQQSAQEAHNDFMNSPSHKDNIVSSWHKGAAYAVVEYKGILYFVQLFEQ